MNIKSLGDCLACSTIMLWNIPNSSDYRYNRSIDKTKIKNCTEYVISETKRVLTDKSIVFDRLGYRVESHSFVIASVGGYQQGAIAAFRKLGFTEMKQKNTKNGTVVYLFSIEAPKLIKNLEKF